MARKPTKKQQAEANKTSIKVPIGDTARRQLTKGLKLNPKTEAQGEFLNLLDFEGVDLVFGIGAAGTGKTLVSLMWSLMNLDNFEKIVYIRPNIAAKLEDSLGALPGCQPLYSKVLTPSGWRLMGELVVGDKVVAHDGTHVDILGIFPKGIKKTFEITTTEGQKTITCDDHLWFTKTTNDYKHGKAGSIKSTKMIRDSLLDGTAKNQLNHTIPRAEKVSFNNPSEMPLNPYLLGVLLGDGSIKTSINFSSIDFDIIDKISKIVSLNGCRLHNTRNTINYQITSDCYNNKPAKSVKITNIENNEEIIFDSIGKALKNLKIKQGALHNRCLREIEIDGLRYEFIEDAPLSNHPIKESLMLLGLHGKGALDKFIPNIFKTASISDRIELLRGLMDTDGTIKKTNGECAFTTISKTLAEDLCELVRSLGGRSTIYTRDRIGKETAYEDRVITTRHISYEVTVSLQDINPFYLPRKADRWIPNRLTHRTKIASIKEIGEENVQCILIDHPDHLYITDDYTVTHNTIEEKLAWLRLPIYDVLDGVINESNISKFFEGGLIEISNVSYLRGRSLQNSIIIIDEAQNLDKHLLKTALTRIGQGSKMILVGDTRQSDLKQGLSALHDFAHKLAVLPEVGLVEFSRQDVVRNPLITRILEIIDPDN
jgi:phosphate starvation-inducible protein PhoH/intein/homing endonuclease